MLEIPATHQANSQYWRVTKSNTVLMYYVLPPHISEEKVVYFYLLYMHLTALANAHDNLIKYI